jgi:hypothetical protein
MRSVDRVHAPDIRQSAEPGVVGGLPLLLLRSEGLALLAIALVLYGSYGGSWWVFLLLLAAPDIGLLGLLWSKPMGAVTYNLTHTYLPPALLSILGWVTGAAVATSIGLIWFAHIGMDRAIGLGLHYPDGSGRTHLSGRGVRRLTDQEGAAWNV